MDKEPDYESWEWNPRRAYCCAWRDPDDQKMRQQIGEPGLDHQELNLHLMQYSRGDTDGEGEENESESDEGDDSE